MKRRIVGVILAIAIGSLAFSIDRYFKNKNAAKERARVAGVHEIETTADELSRMYMQSPVEAQQRFENKAVRVHGQVESTLNFFGDYSVVLKAKSSLQVVCIFGGENREQFFAECVPGSEVTFVGICKRITTTAADLDYIALTYSRLEENHNAR